MNENPIQDLFALSHKLEASLDKSDALVRIEHSGKLLGHHIVANQTGMLALGVECLKASTQSSVNTSKTLPFETQSLSYLAAGDCCGINGLFVDNGIEYEKRPTKEELDREDTGFSFSDLFVNVMIWAFVGFAVVGVVATIRWLWGVVV